MITAQSDLLNVTDFLRTTDRSQTSSFILLDFSASFDAIDLQKLHSFISLSSTNLADRAA